MDRVGFAALSNDPISRYESLHTHLSKKGRQALDTDTIPDNFQLEFLENHIDQRALKITLIRGPCLGTCPVYKVSIDGMGNVLFDGDVRAPSPPYSVQRVYRNKISTTSVHALFAAFERARFFWLYDNYGSAALDAPICSIGVEFDQHRKKVIDFGCQADGMPKEAAALEGMIDHAVNIDKLMTYEPAPLDPPPLSSLIEPEQPHASQPKITIEGTEQAR